MIWLISLYNFAELLEKYALMIDILRFELNIMAAKVKGENEEKKLTCKYYWFLGVNMALYFFLIFFNELLFDIIHLHH